MKINLESIYKNPEFLKIKEEFPPKQHTPYHWGWELKDNKDDSVIIRINYYPTTETLSIFHTDSKHTNTSKNSLGELYKYLRGVTTMGSIKLQCSSEEITISETSGGVAHYRVIQTLGLGESVLESYLNQLRNQNYIISHTVGTFIILKQEY